MSYKVINNGGARVAARSFLGIVIILVALVSLAPANSAGQALLFGKPLVFDSGAYATTSVAVADVNGDGKPDLVVANSCASYSDCSHGSVGVLLSKGYGQFWPVRLYNSGGFAANSIAVADVNRDGKPDLIVTNCALGQQSSCPAPGRNGAVGILLGNGDGTFQPVVTYDSGGQDAWSVVAIDVNRDGKLDLVVANYSNPSTVSVLLGNGDGSFQFGPVYTLAGWGAVSLAAGDVNGDGIQDLLVSCQTADVAVLLGNGDGTFRVAGSYSSGSFNHWGVVAADVNGDGKLDMIVANADMGIGAATVAVLMGNGDGTFQPAVTYDSGGIGAVSVAVGDMNGDGKVDIAVANEVACNTCTDGSVGVLLGNGNGTFQPPKMFDSGGYATRAIRFTDVNSDSMGDLVTASICGKIAEGNACPGDGSVGVLLNRPHASRLF